MHAVIQDIEGGKSNSQTYKKAHEICYSLRTMECPDAMRRAAHPLPSPGQLEQRHSPDEQEDLLLDTEWAPAPVGAHWALGVVVVAYSACLHGAKQGLCNKCQEDGLGCPDPPWHVKETADSVLLSLIL